MAPDSGFSKETATTVTAAPATVPDDGDQRVLDCGFDGTVPWPRHIALSLQNMVVMAGLFLFPGVFGAAYHLSSLNIAKLYGAAFVVVGFGTLLQGLLRLNMPLVTGPWAGSLAGLLVLGKIYGLGTAFGSLMIASVILSI